MTDYPGGVAVTGYISPTAITDHYATHKASFGQGGYRSVADIIERDAIDPSRREAGMLVYVLSEKKEYRLVGGILNTNWVYEPISAYEIAKNYGYAGTETQWLASLKGADGKSAYQIAVANGYTGTESQWSTSLKGLTGADGRSAYQIAVANGYVGTESQWLVSLKGLSGADGKSAYQIAVANGYTGTEQEWITKLNGILTTTELINLIHTESIDAVELERTIAQYLQGYLPLYGGKMQGAITAIRETSSLVAASTIDTTLGNVFYKTITSATTFTFAGALPSPAVNSFILELTNGGAFTITWPAGVQWQNAIKPTLTSAGTDILGFYSYDGGKYWRGVLLSKNIG